MPGLSGPELLGGEKMNDKRMQALAETIYALITCGLVVLFTLIVIDGWSNDICQQRASWEATGHEYVGIPAGSEHC